jgi:hypothetical protein
MRNLRDSLQYAPSVNSHHIGGILPYVQEDAILRLQVMKRSKDSGHGAREKAQCGMVPESRPGSNPAIVTDDEKRRPKAHVARSVVHELADAEDIGQSRHHADGRAEAKSRIRCEGELREAAEGYTQTLGGFQNRPFDVRSRARTRRVEDEAFGAARAKGVEGIEPFFCLLHIEGVKLQADEADDMA